jgi:DNA (cytosine-5)-methyltransferase 1
MSSESRRGGGRLPCTDLSQAGRTRGIRGQASGLIAEVFRLLNRIKVPIVLLENVRNMLVLDGGDGMRYLVSELEALNYRWAYRLVDSRFSGVPQRRQRVIFVASRDVDPRGVLFADDAGEPESSRYSHDCFGFYWTGRCERSWVGKGRHTYAQRWFEHWHPVTSRDLGTVQ